MPPKILNVAEIDEQGVFEYGPYKPWGLHKAQGGDGSNYPTRSKKLLDLKDKIPQAIEHFRSEVAPHLGAGIAIAIVPSHDPAKTDSGIRILGQRLAVGGRVDATGCLVRHTKIPKLASGGDRSVTVHLESIRVDMASLIKGRRVLILDDVATTGNSLIACRQILLEAGAAEVKCAALGKTE